MDRKTSRINALALGLVLLSAASLRAETFSAVFPQFASGPGITTAFSVHNPSTTETVALKVELFRTRDLGGGELFSTVVPLNPGATEEIEFRSQELVAGWGRLSSEQVFSSTAFLKVFSGEELVSQVGILPAPAVERFGVFGYRDPGLSVNTGVAIVNPSEDSSAEVSARQLDETGQELGRTVFVLEPGEHLARNINEPPFFEGTEQYRGTIEFQTKGNVVPLSLRQDGLVTASAPVFPYSAQVSTVALQEPLFDAGGRTVGGPGICRTNRCDVLRLLTGPEEPLSRQGLDVCFTLRSRTENTCAVELKVSRAASSSPTSRTLNLGTQFESSYCDADVVSISLNGPANCDFQVEWRVDSIGNQ